MIINTQPTIYTFLVKFIYKIDNKITLQFFRILQLTTTDNRKFNIKKFTTFQKYKRDQYNRNISKYEKKIQKSLCKTVFKKNITSCNVYNRVFCMVQKIVKTIQRCTKNKLNDYNI